MVRNSSRCGRLGDLIHREMARIIRDECSTPRLGMVTISSVVVTEDLSFARIYFTVLQDDMQRSSVEELNHAAGFLRTHLAKKLTLRTVPKLSFIYDSSLNTGTRIAQLLDSVKDPNDEASE